MSPRALASVFSRLVSTVLLVAAAAASTAAADTASGLRLARHWCVSCHLVEPDGRGTDTAAPFEAIANNPSYGIVRLRGWLTEPLPPMPDLNLTRSEITAIMDYLESLKKD